MKEQTSSLKTRRAGARLLLLLLLLCAQWGAQACQQTIEYSRYPTHLHLRAECKSEAEAKAACTAFAESFGYTSSSCVGAYTAGHFRIDQQTWIIGSFNGGPDRAAPEKNMGPPECPGQCFGDPINAGNGNKFESKVEYRGDGPFPLEFSWTYNYQLPGASWPPHAYALGARRTYNYGSRIGRWMIFGGYLDNSVLVSRPDGKIAGFSKNQAGDWVAAPGQDHRLKQLANGWEYQDDDGHFETFNSDGLLIELRDPQGYRQTLEYDASGRLARVKDYLGRQMSFDYNASNWISQVNLPDGRTIKFAYTPQDFLSVVEYQDGTTIKYLYDESGYIGSRNTRNGALTGVEDESGNRYSSTNYNWDLALGTELAGSLDRYSADYERSGNRTYMAYSAVGLPSGATRKLYLMSVNWKIVPRKIVTECTGCASRTLEYAYDTNGRYDIIDDNGVKTDYDYDARGLPLQVVEAANDTTGHRRTTQTDWHALFRVPLERRVLDANGALTAKTAWTYNDRGQTLTQSQIDPSGQLAPRVSTYRYCEQPDIATGTCPLLGLPLSVDGPRTDLTDVTRYAYYPSDDAACASAPSTCAHRKGDVWKIENALGQTTLEVLRYDGAGRPLSSRDSNGIVTDYEFNTRGWLTATKTRGGDNASENDDRIVRLDYWPTGLVKQVTLPDGSYARYTYDSAHRLTAIADEAGNSLQYTLDSRGNRTREDVKTAAGAVTKTSSRVFNLLNELQAVRDASQNATTLTYDSRGNPNTATDSLGRTTDSDHDPLNRLVRTLQDAAGLAVETKLAYDANDRLTRVTDPNGLNTNYGYNGLGDPIRLDSPDTGVTEYTYNAAGQLATKKDANDAVAHRYSYDALNRPTAIFYTASGPADVEYSYDSVNAECGAGETFALGRLSLARTDGTELKYCYDRFGQVVRKVQVVAGKSFTLRYAYTLGGQLSAITYPDGAVVDYVRDAQARIKEIGVRPNGGTRTTLLSNATYAPFGPATGWTYGNGRTLSRSYDQDYRPKSVLDNASGGLSLGYGYNTVGDLTELKDGLQSAVQAKYDYDALSRLTVTRDSAANPVETYTYDQTGNRTSLLHGGITDTYAYSATSHRLGSVAGVTRSYDAAGNTLNIGGTAREFVYDANDRLSQFKQAGVIKASYRYNAIGERVAATGGTTGTIGTYTLYDEAGHWIGDYDGTGATKQQAVWFGSAPVGLVVGSGATQSLRYVQPDHLGTPRAVIDPARNVAVWTWDAKSEAFGNSAPNQDPDQDGTAFTFDMRFPGQRFDAASGLVYNYYRDYDPASSRYIQSDPIGLRGGISTYGYVAASPLTGIDPFGLEILGIHSSAKYGDWSPDSGHAWLAIYSDDGKLLETWGAWLPSHFRIKAKNTKNCDCENSNVYKNIEKDNPVTYKAEESFYIYLSPKELTSLRSFIAKEWEFGRYRSNCAAWVDAAVEGVFPGIPMNATDGLGAAFATTPRAVSRSLHAWKDKFPDNSVINPLRNQQGNRQR